MNKASRFITPDILKGVAVLLMIQVHIMELFAQQGIFDSILGKVSLFMGGPPVAPVFMAILGYFVISSNKSFRESVFRGLKLILTGLLLNIGLNFHVLIHIFFENARLNPLEFIFGADILILSGISVIIITFIRRTFSNFYLPYILLSVLAILLTPYFNQYLTANNPLKFITAFFGGGYRWSYFPVFPWIAYPLLGAGFRIFSNNYKVEQLSEIFRLIITIATGIFILITIKYASEITHNLKHYYHHGLKYYFWTLLFLVFWVSLFSFVRDRKEKNPVLNFLKWVGKNVTVFYIIQWILIGNIATSIYKTQSLAKLPLWFIFITVCTCVLVIIYNRILNLYIKKEG
ncbi:MAG: DUF1624 domain-containing protein [Bacteroidia bacterium]|nr:DUF1624 domain-containing protein [Bacteroidia bacterium]